MPKGERGAAIEIRGFWRAIKYFVLVFTVGWLIGWVPTRALNLDLLIWNWLVTFHLANWWLFIIYSVLAPCFGYILYWNWRKNREAKRRQQQFRDKLGTIEYDDL